MNLNNQIASFSINDIYVGQCFSEKRKITNEDLDKFASLTGDISPIHIDKEYAISRGFKGRVAHGILLAGFISKIFGVNLPGKLCILHSINLKWLKPVCVDDCILIETKVTQVSIESEVFVCDVRIFSSITDEVVSRGKVQAGIMKEK
jgi:3-hydroxybutyryl-CoA dehydratase